MDAFVTYGVSLESEGMSKLMTPAPHKEPVQNKNLAMNGTAIVGAVARTWLEPIPTWREPSMTCLTK